MKVILKLELNLKEAREFKAELTEDELKDELIQMLFEVCEEWVLRGTQPDLDFEN